MTTFNFKKFVNKRTIRSILEPWSKTLSIWNTQRELLFGENTEDTEHPLQIYESLIGWFRGDASHLSLVQFLIEQEVEKKQLAQEVLDKYKEINLLFYLSEKITSTQELAKACQLLIDQVRKLVDITSGSVHLLSQKHHILEPLAIWGEAEYLQENIYPAEGLIGDVFVTGKGEVVNDLSQDERYVLPYDKVRAMICVPLKHSDRTFGVATFGNYNSMNYRAQDLKLLNSIAAMAAPMINAARLHTEQLKESYDREEKLKLQITELRIEIDSVKSIRQIGEVSEVDFFQRLQQKLKEKSDS